MENPKTATAFFIALLALPLLILLGASIYYGEFSVLMSALAVVGLVLVGSAVLALVLAIEIGPLLWLCSWLSSRKPKRKR